MRRVFVSMAVCAACSGGEPSGDAAASREVVQAPAVDEGGEESTAEPEALEIPAGPGRLVEGETDAELPANAEAVGETEGAVPPPPGEPPPPIDDANQPAAPDAAPGPVVDPNLDPAHLEQVREADMSEREKRAARARAARKAYEQ